MFGECKRPIFSSAVFTRTGRKLRPVLFNLLQCKLKHKVGRKPVRITAELLIQSLCRHPVNTSQIIIQDYFLSSNCNNCGFNRNNGMAFLFFDHEVFRMLTLIDNDFIPALIQQIKKSSESVPRTECQKKAIRLYTKTQKPFSIVATHQSMMFLESGSDQSQTPGIFVLHFSQRPPIILFSRMLYW